MKALLFFLFLTVIFAAGFSMGSSTKEPLQGNRFEQNGSIEFTAYHKGKVVGYVDSIGKAVIRRLSCDSLVIVER